MSSSGHFFNNPMVAVWKW